MNKVKEILLYSNKMQMSSISIGSQNLSIRTYLKDNITLVIKERGYSQKELSNILSVSQPRISNLLRDGESNFSIDALVNFLDKLAVQVSVNCHLSEKNAKPTSLKS